MELMLSGNYLGLKLMKSITFFSLLILVCPLWAQSPITIAESTVKVNGLGEEVFYYGFAEGDQLIFDFQELKDKELKELEIIEMPASSKFMDFKTKRIKEKSIPVTNTGIYKFRFNNSALSGRVCKFKIQRIPASEETANFNTNVYWSTVNDTSYVMEQERYLIRRDTIITNLTEQTAKVHSQGNSSGNKTSFNFLLPENTVSWSYYMGVDQTGQESFAHAVNELAEKTSPMVASIPGYGPLAALALGNTSFLTQMQKGEDVDFYITDNDNVNLFLSNQAFSYFKKGKVINDFSRMTAPLSGMLHVCLANDNAITGITVSVRVTAIQVIEEWGTRQVQRKVVTPRQVAYLKN